MEVTLKMSVEEANAILQVLGQLPTSSGAYPLLLKLKAQADEQVKPAEIPAA
jgi:hypothetical protein